MSDITKPGIIDIEKLYEDNLQFTEDEFNEAISKQFMVYKEDANFSAKLSKIAGGVIPTLLDMNGSVASQTAANAIDHNAIPAMVLDASIIVSVGFIAFKTLKSLETDGSVAALQTFGIEVVKEGLFY